MNKSDYVKVFIIMLIGQLCGNFVWGIIEGLLK